MAWEFAGLPDPDRRPQQNSEADRRRASTVRIQDLGPEVHLWVAQRVPWPVALEIMRLLKVPDEPEEPGPRPPPPESAG
jgi:hypothetical protein